MGRRRKNLIGSFSLGEDDFTCSRWEHWPPIEIIIHEEPLRVRGELGNEAYHRVRIWEDACGLLQMSPDKCPNCPYVAVNGVLAEAAGGGGYKPQTTKATRIAAMRKKR